MTEDKRDNSAKQRQLDSFKESIKRVGSRYEVALPWKPNVNLDDNREMSEKRLTQLTNRLQKTLGLLREYEAVMRQYCSEGMAEPVTRNDVDEQKPTYYMLHQAVLRESSGTARLRVVFDASSHGNKSKSLNQNLESGPNLIADLVGLLLNFRSHRIALVERRMIQILQATSSTAVPSVLNIERYSDAARLFWVTAWILRYVGKLRHVSSNTGQLTAIELDRAEKY